MVQQRGPISTRVLHGPVGAGAKTSGRNFGTGGAKKPCISTASGELRDYARVVGTSSKSPQLDFLETHPLIRNLDTYQDCVPD